MMLRFIFLIYFIILSFNFSLAFSADGKRPQKHNVSAQKQSKTTFDFTPYPHLTPEMKERMAPYIISDTHPKKKQLDHIFSKKRVTQDRSSFLNSGFQIIGEGPRSYILVAKHPLLTNYLIKAYLDTETREKWDRPSWYWLAKRCEGAKKIDKIIKDYKIKHFRVAKKWIYLVPIIDKAKPFLSCYTRHPAILLVTDMDLVSEKENLYAWKHYMTKEKLDELFLIITLAKGASYRADNVAMSRSGKFCFIDCEYPSSGPEYDKVTYYLNSSMKQYWEYLIKKRERIRKNEK